MNLSELKEKDKYVIVPANICYAAVFPILSAGLKPLFCDVDSYSGNVTTETIDKVLRDDVVAAIIPHMYGNPVRDLIKIGDRLSQRNIILIEDCASLMTNIKIDYFPGTIGDYVIYSTGYSKTIDLGMGGLLFSKKHSLDSICEHEKQLPLFKDYFEKETSLFSKIYRLFRNQRHESDLEKEFYKGLKDSFERNFLYRIDDNTQAQVLNEIKKLDEVICVRHRQYNLYKSKLVSKYNLYEFEDNAVPWRFNFFIDEDRDGFIQYCLKNSLPVSDWYPCVTPIFGETDTFVNALWHEKHIINFPLMISEEEIDKICQILIEYKGDLEDE